MELDLKPFEGQWVVFSGATLAGSAPAAEDAIAAAKLNGFSAPFTCRFVEEEIGALLALAPLLQQLQPLFATLPYPVYLVGGAVRDALLGKQSHDLDFIVPRLGIRTAFTVADWLKAPAYILDKERDTARVVLGDGVHLDFARFRGDDLPADLRARDFTINALALPATAVRAASVIDVVEGVADLNAGRLQITHPAALRGDPVRSLRGVRLAHQLGFIITAETRTAIADSILYLSRSSPERLRDEFLKIMQLPAPQHPLAELAKTGLLAGVLPVLAALQNVAQSPPHHEPVWAHTLSVVSRLCQIETALSVSDAADPLAALLTPYRAEITAHWAREFDGGLNGGLVCRLGALFHDVGKAETLTVSPEGRIHFYKHDRVGAEIAARTLRRLALSKQVINHVQQIVAGHMRPLLLAKNERLSRRAIYRFFRATEHAGVDILLVALADHLATYDGWGPAQAWADIRHVIAECLWHYFRKHEETVAPPPLVDGRTLMTACQISPGPEVGRLLRLIQEQQAAGRLHTRAEAIAFARKNCS